MKVELSATGRYKLMAMWGREPNRYPETNIIHRNYSFNQVQKEWLRVKNTMMPKYHIEKNED